MKKKIGIVIVMGGVIFFGMLVWQKWIPKTISDGNDVTERKLSVVATFYPLGEFARAVGGDAVDVSVIVPSGSEPHEYEPTPKDILAAYEADVFLLNGAGLDPWAEKIRPELKRRGVTVIQMSENVELLSDVANEDDKEHTSEEEQSFDPHFWLDPLSAAREVTAIHDAFVARDGAHRALYDRNGEAYAKELESLDTAYGSALIDCRLDTIVTSHDAFSYLAKRYDFRTLSVSGLAPEAEPSPRRLAEIATTIRTSGIRHIFFETLVSPEVAETLAREVGAETLIFDPLEGITDEDQKAGKNYTSVMLDNLDALQTALECQ